jgi:CheY-like chemotaxis protein
MWNNLPATTGDAMRVLIAEDSVVARKLLERNLQQLGYEVIATEDGAQAWEAYQKTPTPIVITDWEMPQMNGVELCRAIRQHPAEQYTYLMMLTARGEKKQSWKPWRQAQTLF